MVSCTYCAWEHKLSGSDRLWLFGRIVCPLCTILTLYPTRNYLIITLAKNQTDINSTIFGGFDRLWIKLITTSGGFRWPLEHSRIKLTALAT